MNRPNVLVAYHANCIDGFTSAWILNRFFNRKAIKVDCIPVNYTEKSYQSIEKVIKELYITDVYIVDFSIPTQLITHITNIISGELWILDHHRTAFEKYFQKDNYVEGQRKTITSSACKIILDDSESGASLVWKHIMNCIEVPNLIRYVREYDLHKFTDEKRARAVNMYLRSLNKTFEDWDKVYTNLEYYEGEEYIINYGNYLLDIFEKNCQDIAKNCYPISFNNISGLAVETHPEYSTRVGNILAEKSGTFGATVYHSDDTVQWSFRSTPETGVNVAAIAKTLGGGGHTRAAGAIIKKDKGNETIN